MSNHDIYDRSLDAPQPVDQMPAAPRPLDQAPALPNEPYYREQPAPRGRRAGFGVALVLIGLVLLASQLLGRGLPLGGGRAITLVDQTLPGNRVELSTASADVEVAVWSQPGIRVEAIQHGGSSGDYTVDVSRSGDTVRVAETSRNWFLCLFCSRDLSYRVSVPASAQASISTASGDVDVSDLAGSVSLSTVSGDVRAADLAGGLTVETTSGDVHLRDIAGKLSVNSISGAVQLDDGKVDGASVKTTSGEVDLDGVAGGLDLSTVSADIKVSGARDGRLTLATTSGDITYAGRLARDGANQISSISGDVRLDLPADTGFRLNASTVSGDLTSDFDLSGGESGGRSLTGVAGDGGATVNVSTTSGEIKIERR